ncbi:hypothetical protein ACNQFZ_19560 [Schinkia sp. CFF1]
MNKWRYLIIPAIIGLTLVGCNSQQDVTKNVQTPTESQGTTSTTETNGQKQSNHSSNIRIYVNQTDAWVVELPSTWNDVHIVENGRMTEFIFPSENPELQQSLFWITAISEAEWKKAQAEGPTGTAKEIIRKDGDVYLYYTPLDMVLEGKELERYEKMVADIPSIINSFTFE